MNTIRFGIIGTNFVSDWLAEASVKSAHCTVTAVYSRAEETGRAFAEKHGIAAVFTDYDKFLTSGLIDAVYVASPNYMHMTQALAAMKRGLHVLCEKPAGLNARQLALMEQTARDNHVLFMEAMRPAFDPVTDRLAGLIGQLGPVRRAVLRMNQYSSRYDAVLRGEVKNAFTPALGNAALMDIGVYCVFLGARLFGMPSRVQADSVFLANGFEGEGTLLLSYPGMQALIEYSKITNSVPGSVIEGEKGYVTFDRISGMTEIRLCLRGKDPEVIALNPVDNNMTYELDYFAEKIMSGGDTEEKLAVTRIQTAIMDAARAASGIHFPTEDEA